MNSPVDELKPCPFCGESDDKKIHVHGPTCKKSDPYNPMDRLYPIVRCISCFASVHGKDEDESCKSAVVAWNTRAESPDSVEGATYEDACDAVQDGFQQLVSVLGIDIDNFDGDEAEAYLLGLGLKKIAEMLKPLGLVFNSDEWVLSPPPPVAAEGELIDKAEEAISTCVGITNLSDSPHIPEMAEHVVSIIYDLKEALQSRSTPPPVAGEELDKLKRALDDCTYSFDGRTKMQAAFDSYLAALQHQDCVVISREDAEEVLAYCNADFIAQGALLNSCVLQTLTAKAIVEGRRCRMGAIAAKLEAALGERNNG